MKERGFEVLLATVSFIGLLVLFTIVFTGPRIILNNILEIVGLS